MRLPIQQSFMPQYDLPMEHPIQFVSLGPGDPELISLRSYHALQNAELILYPATQIRGDETVSRAAAQLSALGIKSVVRPFYLPMLNDRSQAMEIYRSLCDELKRISSVLTHIVVAVEGDASIYASIHYLIEMLVLAGIPVEQQPGIPSFIASAAVAQLHLVSGDERLWVIPGTATADELHEALQSGCIPVVMKLSRCKAEMKRLIILHPEYRFHYFENVGTPQQVYTNQIEEILSKDFPTSLS